MHDTLVVFKAHISSQNHEWPYHHPKCPKEDFKMNFLDHEHVLEKERTPPKKEIGFENNIGSYP